MSAINTNFGTFNTDSEIMVVLYQPYSYDTEYYKGTLRGIRESFGDEYLQIEDEHGKIWEIKLGDGDYATQAEEEIQAKFPPSPEVAMEMEQSIPSYNRI